MFIKMIILDVLVVFLPKILYRNCVVHELRKRERKVGSNIIFYL